MTEEYDAEGEPQGAYAEALVIATWHGSRPGSLYAARALWRKGNGDLVVEHPAARKGESIREFVIRRERLISVVTMELP